MDERHFLNLPGHHGDATIAVYLEDTSERKVDAHPCRDYDDGRRTNFEGRSILEISDCSETIRLELEHSSEERMRNSMYKLDTLIASLQKIRSELPAERELYVAREKEIEEWNERLKEWRKSYEEKNPDDPYLYGKELQEALEQDGII